MTESEELIPQRLAPVARLLGEGKENDEIAKTLGYSQHTIENYISELKELLGARGRTDLAFKCMKLRS
ncbi:MAG: helix-turn-helix transcriptional regulator [Dehalococcoidia bacterium]